MNGQGGYVNSPLNINYESYKYILLLFQTSCSHLKFVSDHVLYEVVELFGDDVM